MGSAASTLQKEIKEKKKQIQEQTRLGHTATTLQFDHCSKVEISVRCEDLPKVDATFCVVYTKWEHEENWTELGRTEVSDSKTPHPNYNKSFDVEFRFERQRVIRFEVYRVRNRLDISDLFSQAFMGGCEAYLSDILMERCIFSQKDPNDHRHLPNGWKTLDLEDPRPKRRDYVSPGRLAVWAEEQHTAKQCMSFVLQAKGIKTTDFWKRRPDPYLIFHRTMDVVDDFGDVSLNTMQVFLTEVKRHTGEPTWDKFYLTVAQLCHHDPSREIIIELQDWFRMEPDRYVGECILCFDHIFKNAKDAGRALKIPICKRVGWENLDSSLVRKPHGGKGSHGHSSHGFPSERSRTSESHTTDSSHGSGSGSGSGFKRYGRQDTKESVDLTAPIGRQKQSSKDKQKTSKEREKYGSKLSSRGRTDTKGTEGDKSVASHSTHSSEHSSEGSSHKRRDLGAPGKLIFGEVMGSLILKEVDMVRGYSFLDYLRGGLEMKMVMAVDFTRSNGGPEGINSLHHAPGTNSSNPYSRAIRSVGEVLCSFTASERFPLYGFGAKIPPTHSVCSDCFALTGDFLEPEVDGVDAAVEAYEAALKIARLHGPTRLSEVIRLAANLARPYADAKDKFSDLARSFDCEMRFFVLVVITDGEIEDQVQTLEEVIAAAEVPLAIVVIGVGGECAFLKELSQEAGALLRSRGFGAGTMGPSFTACNVMPPPKREVVKFVDFEDFKDRGERLATDLAAAALCGMPKEVMGFFGERDVRPRGLKECEDDAGIGLPKVTPAQVHRAPEIESGRSATKGSGVSDNTVTSTRTSGTMTSMKSMMGGTMTSTMTGAMSRKKSRSGSKAPSKHRLEHAEKTKMAEHPFLKTEQARILDEAVKLGYESHLVKRVLKEGIPAMTLEVLSDNVLFAGYGKSASYKDLLETFFRDKEEAFKAAMSSTASTADSRAQSMIADGERRGSKVGEEVSRMLSSVVSHRVSTMLPESSIRQSSASPSVSKDPSVLPSIGRLGSHEEARLLRFGSPTGTKERVPSKSILRKESKPDKEGQMALPDITEGRTGSKGKVSFKEGPTSPMARGDSKFADSLRAVASVNFASERGTAPTTPADARANHKYGTCSICLEEPVTMEFVPCGHRIACQDCAKKLGVTCALCSATIDKVKPIDERSSQSRFGRMTSGAQAALGSALGGASAASDSVF